MRAAIYARFSTDLQNDRSVDDQFALCEAYVRKAGWRLSGRYADHAASGASIHGRPDYQRLIGLALAGELDLIVAEDLDRLSRNLADIARLFETLTFAGVKIVTVADGEVSEMHIGIKGTMSALFLKGLAQKIRRGMAGVVREGRNAGGRAYGYRPVPGRVGELEIVDAEAETIRRIFTEYAEGRSPRVIAGCLNEEGILPPRGRFWTASTINGNRQRGHGILVNPLYAGRPVWNRVRMIKDPATGKRISRINPADEHQASEAPQLAIVAADLYAAVQERRGGRREMAPRQRVTPRHLLSGLLRCGACDAGMSVKDRDHGRVRIRCTQAAEANSCSNRRAYYLDGIEADVVVGLREQLGHRDAIALYLRVYNEERQRLAADKVNERARIERKLAAAEREHERVYRAYVKGLIEEDELERELPPLKVVRDRLRSELAATDEPPRIVSLHPAAVTAYLRAIDTLHETIAAGAEHGEESKQALRSLIDKIVVMPGAAGASPALRIDGHLTKLIGGEHFPSRNIVGGADGSGRGTRTPDTRIMIPLL